MILARSYSDCFSFSESFVDGFFTSSQGKLLELGCGPGPGMRLALNRGWQAKGIDLNPAMIEQAEVELSKHSNYHSAELVCDDIVRADYGRDFDLILCVSNTLTLIKNPEDRIQVLKNVREALGAGGRMILEILNSTEISVKKSRKSHFHLDGKVYEFAIDSRENNAEMTRVFTLEYKAEGFHKKIEIPSYRIPVEQMKEEIKAAGLVVESLYGSAAGESYAAHSMEQVFVLKK